MTQKTNQQLQEEIKQYQDRTKELKRQFSENVSFIADIFIWPYLIFLGFIMAVGYISIPLFAFHFVFISFTYIVLLIKYN